MFKVDPKKCSDIQNADHILMDRYVIVRDSKFYRFYNFQGFGPDINERSSYSYNEVQRIYQRLVFKDNLYIVQVKEFFHPEVYYITSGNGNLFTRNCPLSMSEEEFLKCGFYLTAEASIKARVEHFKSLKLQQTQALREKIQAHREIIKELNRKIRKIYPQSVEFIKEE